MLNLHNTVGCPQNQHHRHNTAKPHRLWYGLTLPGIVFSQKQTSDTVAWPPAPSCDLQAPSTQLPRFQGQQFWSWCFLCWGSGRWCWCLLGVPVHGLVHSAKQFQFRSVSSPFENHKGLYSTLTHSLLILHLCLSKIIIFVIIHSLGFFLKQNILETRSVSIRCKEGESPGPVRKSCPCSVDATSRKHEEKN